MRAASYAINFHEKISELYDVDANDKRVEKQIKSLRKDIENLRSLLGKNPDSTDKYLDEMKNKLKLNNP
jgi:hypothetical protein